MLFLAYGTDSNDNKNSMFCFTYFCSMRMDNDTQSVHLFFYHLCLPKKTTAQSVLWYWSSLFLVQFFPYQEWGALFEHTTAAFCVHRVHLLHFLTFIDTPTMMLHNVNVTWRNVTKRMRSSLVRMRSSLVRMRSSLVVRASDCQCTSCNGPGFDPSIRRHSGIWGAADETVLNIVRTKKNKKKSPQCYKTWLHTT